MTSGDQETYAQKRTFLLHLECQMHWHDTLNLNKALEALTELRLQVC